MNGPENITLILVGLVTLAGGFVLGSIIDVQPQELSPAVFDENYFEERFNRLETGIVNSSQDNCSLVGGLFPLDQNSFPVFYSMDLVVDANRGLKQEVTFWPCVIPRQ